MLLATPAAAPSIKVDGQLKPIAFASRVFTPTECNFSATEREALGLLFVCNSFRPFLWGRHATAYVDHAPLRQIFAKDLPPGRLCRFALSLQQYSIDIVYRKGATHSDADALSRLIDLVFNEHKSPPPSPDNLLAPIAFKAPNCFKFSIVNR